MKNRTIKLEQGSVEGRFDMLIAISISIQGDELEDIREFFHKNNGKTASLSVPGKKAIKFKIV